MRKSVLSIFFLCLLHIFSQAQPAPDLSKLNSLNARVEAWRNYCNQLLTETSEFRKLAGEARRGISMVPPDSVKIKSMFNLFAGCAYENTKQYDSAIYFLNESVRLARKIGKTTYEITALSRLNYIYDYTRNSRQRKITIDRMVEIADTSTNASIKVLAVGALGGFYADVNDYENAIKYKIKQIELEKESIRTDTLATDPINVAYNMNNLANLFNSLGRHQKALEYLNEARPLMGDRALTGNEDSYYSFFINAFLGINKIDSARYYYDITNAAMKDRDTLYNTLSTQNFLFGDYFLSHNNIDSALKYALKSKRFGKQSAERGTYIIASHLLGKIYFAQGKYRESLAEMNVALQNDFEFDRQTFAEIQKTTAASYAKLGKWDSAYTHFAIYSNLNDSLEAAAANKNFADAEAIYQNKEKQQQIITKNLELKSARTQKIWLVAGLSLLILITLLLIIIYKNKKKTADLLNEKNKTLSVLNTDLESANRTKAKLFGIISHDLRSPISQVYQFLKLQQLNPHALNEIQKADLNIKIQTATGSLLETMEDLLLWSKTQLNEFKADIQQTPLLPLVNACQSLLQLNIDSKNIQVNKNIGEDIIVQTDPYYLQTIVRNLLQNAVKASPENKSISIFSIKENEKILLQIENDGASLSQSKYEQMLLTENTSATLNGLGLRLVHELAEKASIQLLFVEKLSGTTVQLHIPLSS